MSLGSTKSKEDPNLHYEVVDGDQVILLLYVDDQFLTGEEKLILDSKKKACCRVRDERPRYNALLLKS